MRQATTRIVLIGSGAILGLIGGALMIAPKTFLELSDVMVKRDPGLMSELTAPAGLLILTGLLMIYGAVKLRFAGLAFFVGAIVYGSYGFGRVVSMTLHGLPSEPLITATIIELAVAVLLGLVGTTATPARTQAERGPQAAQMTC